jgi:hypothetical protein
VFALHEYGSSSGLQSGEQKSAVPLSMQPLAQALILP